MTIEINKPELEAAIRQRLETGQFESVEDVLWQALNPTSPQNQPASASRRRPAGRPSLAQLFAESPFQGLGIEFERFPDTWPPVAP